MNFRGLQIPAFVSGLLVAGLISGTASAQEWLRDRRYAEGPGYQTGDFTLHPGLGVAAGYDSNYLMRTNQAGASNGCPNFCPEQSAGMNVTPSIAITTTQAPQRLEGQPGGAATPRPFNFSAGLSGTYHEDFGTLHPEQRNVGLTQDAHLDILPGRIVGGDIYETYARTIQPSVFGNPDIGFNRDDISVGADFVVTPGQGTLDWRLGYQFHDSLFEESAAQSYDSITNEISTRGRWKFRPRTALLYDATLRFGTYTNGAGGVITDLHNSTPIRTRIGMNGLITERLSVTAMVGWGASFFVPGSDPHVQQYDSVIGTAQVTYALGKAPAPGESALALAQDSVSAISIGYNRDFSGSLISDYNGSDRGYVHFALFFAGRALVTLEGGVTALEFPEIYLTQSLINAGGSDHNAFTDLRADGTLFGEYRFLDSLAANLTLRYTSEISNTQLNLGNTNGTYAMQWQRFEAYAGVRWFM